RATGREEGGHGPQISTLRAEPIEPRIPHGSSEVTQIAADVRANEVGGRDVSSPTRGSREGRVLRVGAADAPKAPSVVHPLRGSRIECLESVGLPVELAPPAALALRRRVPGPWHSRQ